MACPSLMTYSVCCMQFGGVDLDPDSSTFWFAGKQLQPDKRLADYLGRNENTRAVVKLQKKGAGPPAREPVSHTYGVQQLSQSFDFQTAAGGDPIRAACNPSCLS
jgi:hypothetical protein